MAKTSAEVEKEFIEGIKSLTGKDLQQWITTINNSGIVKRNDIIKWLKSDPGFRHMHASLLTGIYLNNGKPVYASETELLNNQFKKYPEMRPLFESFQSIILNWDSHVRFVVKKTYVSMTKKTRVCRYKYQKRRTATGYGSG